MRASLLQQRLLDGLPGDVEHRLARLLLTQAHQGQVALSQAVIAELLGVHRASISRVLNEFKAAGLVELGYRKVRVLEPEELRRVAGLSGQATSPAPSGAAQPAPSQGDRNLPRQPVDSRLPRVCTQRRRNTILPSSTGNNEA